jgi:hypothetical protein
MLDDPAPNRAAAAGKSLARYRSCAGAVWGLLASHVRASVALGVVAAVVMVGGQGLVAPDAHALSLPVPLRKAERITSSHTGKSGSTTHDKALSVIASRPHNAVPAGRIKSVGGARSWSRDAASAVQSQAAQRITAAPSGRAPELGSGQGPLASGAITADGGSTKVRHESTGQTPPVIGGDLVSQPDDTPPPLCTNLLTNPGFESGDVAWVDTPNVVGQWGPEEPAHSGTWSAWLDGDTQSNTDSISQSVSIPADSTAVLSYYVHIDTSETSASPIDTMTVAAGSVVLQTLSNLNAAAGYLYEQVDLSAYAGQGINLSFTGVQAGAVTTSFVLDDLSVSSPSITSAPSAPTAVSAVRGDASAVVTWAAPASNGGCPVTGYTVTANPGGLTTTTAGATTGTVSGLTNGTPYTFTVTAANTAGTSIASPASSPVTPVTVPGQPTAVSATAGNAAAVVTWAAPASNGGSVITGYTVTANPGGLTTTTAGATTGTVSGLTNGTPYTFTVTAANTAGTSIASPASSPVTPQVSGFVGMTPVRVLDTRSGLGAPKAKVGQGATLTVTVPGLAAGTTAVALNVTATNPSSGGYLTVYPGGAPRPGASNLNWVAGQTIPNMVEVQLGPGNTVTFYNAAGTVDVMADLMGYYTPGIGGGFTGRSPARVLDTRIGLGGPQGGLGAGASETLSIPNLPAGTTAVALNVTATDSSTAGWLSVYPGAQARPGTSNLNWVTGQTIPNMVLVPLGAGNTVTFYNAAGTVDVIADVLGYFQPGTGAGFTGISPNRVLDTRIGLGAPQAQLGAHATLTLTVPGLPAGTTAVAMNVTITGPTMVSYLTVYPGGQPQPGSSNLNYVEGQTIPNMVLVPLGPGNTVTLYNSTGTTDVIGDVMGYYG